MRRSDLVAAGERDGFWHQVETSGDTVCGRHPVSLLLTLVALLAAGLCGLLVEIDRPGGTEFLAGPAFAFLKINAGFFVDGVF